MSTASPSRDQVPHVTPVLEYIHTFSVLVCLYRQFALPSIHSCLYVLVVTNHTIKDVPTPRDALAIGNMLLTRLSLAVVYLAMGPARGFLPRAVGRPTRSASCGVGFFCLEVASDLTTKSNARVCPQAARSMGPVQEEAHPQDSKRVSHFGGARTG